MFIERHCIMQASQAILSVIFFNSTRLIKTLKMLQITSLTLFQFNNWFAQDSLSLLFIRQSCTLNASWAIFNLFANSLKAMDLMSGSQQFLLSFAFKVLNKKFFLLHFWKTLHSQRFCLRDLQDAPPFRMPVRKPRVSSVSHRSEAD